MRKILAGAGLLLVMVIPAAALANPARDNKNGPHKDYISGTVNVPLPTPLGTFAAVSSSNGTTEPNGHSGDQATGTWSTDFPSSPLGPVHIGGNILCINATRGVENAADWRGVITETNVPAFAPIGAGVLARNVDNGSGPPDDPPDRTVGFVTPPPGPNPVCPNTFITTNPITSGDLVVHDGGF
jgi:hypothetical protein